jgi:hypothetical protein
MLATAPSSTTTPADGAAEMAQRQGATPPPWRGQPRWRLLAAAIGGWRQNWDKLVQLVSLVAALFRPALVRRRLDRLRAQSFVDRDATIAQLLVAARDQMVLNLGVETKKFYESQGIPWGFHNFRRVLGGPATMLDPVGLFSPRETIVHHVLSTFHRHPVYDLALLAAHEGGWDALEAQADATLAGTHPHQRAFVSLIEDGAYHGRLPAEIAAFRAAPHAPPRDIPAGLLPDPELMLGMDQFKDLRGLVRYASRLRAGRLGALFAWLAAGFDTTLGAALGVKLGPRGLQIEACDPDLVARHLPPQR